MRFHCNNEKISFHWRLVLWSTSLTSLIHLGLLLLLLLLLFHFFLFLGDIGFYSYTVLLIRGSVHACTLSCGRPAVILRMRILKQ